MKQELEELQKSGGELKEPISFYSNSSGLIIHANHGKYIEVDGGIKRLVGEKFISFNPMGHSADGVTFGIFSTKDPELALFLMKRREEKGDIMNASEFYEICSPAKQRLDLERVRRIEVENELELFIAAQNILKAENERLKAEAERAPAKAK